MDKKLKEFEEQRKIFTDTSLNWCPRDLNNSKWVGINNWAKSSDDLKWHQQTDN